MKDESTRTPVGCQHGARERVVDEKADTGAMTVRIASGVGDAQVILEDLSSRNMYMCVENGHTVTSLPVGHLAYISVLMSKPEDQQLRLVGPLTQAGGLAV
jgi:hypothetical protein